MGISLLKIKIGRPNLENMKTIIKLSYFMFQYELHTNYYIIL